MEIQKRARWIAGEINSILAGSMNYVIVHCAAFNAGRYFPLRELIMFKRRALYIAWFPVRLIIVWFDTAARPYCDFVIVSVIECANFEPSSSGIDLYRGKASRKISGGAPWRCSESMHIRWDAIQVDQYVYVDAHIDFSNIREKSGSKNQNKVCCIISNVRLCRVQNNAH